MKYNLPIQGLRYTLLIQPDSSLPIIIRIVLARLETIQQFPQIIRQSLTGRLHLQSTPQPLSRRPALSQPFSRNVFSGFDLIYILNETSELDKENFSLSQGRIEINLISAL